MFWQPNHVMNPSFISLFKYDLLFLYRTQVFLTDAGNNTLYAFDRQGNLTIVATGLKHPVALTADRRKHKLYFFENDQ